ncbi:hypothetical protein F2Q69_00019928 [Brassica cretica]|uniref:Uncharacterized protein n=1 Tax=Brassica cretica TaxID=69181 RepID=A0A8S9QHD6_BRACR|nr:hypothetical protein F2Q69_00019928 [Brassica cretica]
MGATLPERRHELDVPYLSERPYQSDLTRSLAISSFWSAKIDPERPPRATTRSLSSSRARSAQRHPKVARVCVDLRHEEQAGSNVPQRLPEVAPNTQSDLQERRAEVAALQLFDLEGQTDPDRADILWEASSVMKLVVTVLQQCCLECLVNPTVRSSQIELKFGRGVVDWFILDLYGGISLWLPESL